MQIMSLDAYLWERHQGGLAKERFFLSFDGNDNSEQWARKNIKFQAQKDSMIDIE